MTISQTECNTHNALQLHRDTASIFNTSIAAQAADKINQTI